MVVPLSEELTFILEAMGTKGPLQSLQMREDSLQPPLCTASGETNGLIKGNRCPLEMIKERTLQSKLLEPVLLWGKERIAGVDIRVCIRVSDRVVFMWPKFMLSYSPSPKPCMWRRPLRRRSKISSFSRLGLCL